MSEIERNQIFEKYSFDYTDEPDISNDCSITKNELKHLENTEFSCQK